MSSWTAGYVSEVAYTHGYYRELSPTLIEFCLLCAMQRHRSGRPRRYLELGFGQGVSLAIHAAASSGEFWGTDFNPVHAANAKDLTAAIGSSVRIFDDSFEDFARRPDLPEFDVITLHGIWSWINDHNREILVDLIRRRLAVGGVVYISYNVIPGWSVPMPLRQLLSLHVETATEKSRPITDRIDSALVFARKVADAGSVFFRQNPGLVARIDSMKAQDHAYLAHEYFNADWHPMAFSKVHEQLHEAKLSYAASAHMADHIQNINLTPEAQKLLAELSNPVLKETVRDYFTGDQFRRDIWVKGARPLDSFEQLQRIYLTRYVLVTSPKAVPKSIQTRLGEATLQQDLYQPLVAALADDDHRPKTMQELCDRLPIADKGPIYQALLVLIGFGYALPCQSVEDEKANLEKSHRFNSHLIRTSYFSSDPCYLASPVTGGGMLVSKPALWMINELQAGVTELDQVVENIWRNLAGRNQKVLRDGKAIETPEANKAEIRQLITVLAQDTLPILESLRIV